MSNRKKPKMTSKVVPFVLPAFRRFEESLAFDAFLGGLEESFGNDTAVSQAHVLWTTLASKVVSDSPLREMNEFLARNRFATTSEKHKATAAETESSDTANVEMREELSKIVSLFVGERVRLDDPCYYFPAGRRFMEVFESTLGSRNPIPIISKGLEAVFSRADTTSGPTQREVCLNRTLEGLLADVCAWTAGAQQDRPAAAVEAWLRLLCGLPAHMVGKCLGIHDPDTLVLALVLPPDLLDRAVSMWSSGLDYEKDDRLVEGLRWLTRLSLTRKLTIDEELTEKLAELGLLDVSVSVGPILPDTLHLAVAVLYCRWMDCQPDAPEIASELPRLLDELSELGQREEGRSPLSSESANNVSQCFRMLHGEEGFYELDVDACEYVVLARALNRGSGLMDPDYFDVVQYGEGGEAVSQRFEEFRSFAAAARRLGLARVAAASWAFFLITHAAKFKGRFLYCDGSELQDELRTAIGGPGGDMVSLAVQIAREVAEQHGETLNAMRLEDLCNTPDGWDLPSIREKAEVLTLATPTHRESAEQELTRHLTQDGWSRLGLEAQSHLIDGWIQVQRSRPRPVNPETLHWGPQALPFLHAIEAALRVRMRPLFSCPDLRDFFARLGPGRKVPTKWTFGELVELLSRHGEFSSNMMQAVSCGGLARLCEDEALIRELRSLIGFRNRAVHPEELPIEEDELVRALGNLISKGFLRDFAARLDPVAGNDDAPGAVQ